MSTNYMWTEDMAKNSSKYIEMRCKIDEVFEHYAKSSEFCRRANIAQRFQMEDRFYHLSMELLKKVIGPFETSN